MPVGTYAKVLKDYGYTAGALTDFDCGFGWVDFYFKMKAAELTPILGTHIQLNLLNDKPLDKAGLSFLVLDERGYKNLSRILSAYSFKTLKSKDVLNWSEGLVCLVSPDHPQLLDAKEFYKSWPRENLYFEVHRHIGAAPEAKAIEAANEFGGRIVATEPSYFLKKENAFAHEVMLSIGEATTLQDEGRPKLPSKDFCLRTREEMETAFQDQPEWLRASDEIAERVNFDFRTDTYHLPSFGKDEDVNERFLAECKKGLEHRLELVATQNPDADMNELRKEYEARLEEECQIIISMKFPGYFLIVADFIQWSKDHDIPVGPGRGSGAGSLAAYCLRITDIDPIKYNLLFERFLNPERVSMPDFDVDFCIKGRDRVIQYVRDKYNLAIEAPPEERLKVSQIITYGKMKSKAVIRDVGRAMGMSYSDVDAIAKLVPNVLNITLEEAFEMEPEFEALRGRDPKAARLLDVAEELEGLNRHTSVHAAGVVIADDILTNYLPLHDNGDSEIVGQFEMKAVEKIGLVKFDFLGLRNLTVIQDCLRFIEKDIDLLKIDYNDPKVMAEISTGETMGVFQLESSGMRDVIRRLQPTVFEDLIAIVALYRPGPLEGGMVDDFILRKRGQKAVTYPAEVLEPILKETYGVFVYQEQVMGTANLMAGFSLGEADLLRRAMGKKIAEEMAKQRVKFVEGATERGYEKALAEKIFDLMSEFAKYGFNKSHAAAYAMITFQTAYLKTYYPEAFFAALLSSEREDTAKLGTIIRTAQKRGTEVLPPHVNYSEVDFSLEKSEEKTSVRFGFSAIKNLGLNVAKAIVEERNRGGAFKDPHDFFNRVPAHLLNKRQCECLIRSGCFDGMGISRASLFASLDALTGDAHASERARRTGQGSLFGARKAKIKQVEEWADRIRLSDEKHLLGTYMTGHPLESYESLLSSYKTSSIQRVLDAPAPPRDREVSLAGLVTSAKTIMTKKGSKMAFFSLEDLEAQIEVVVFSDLFSKKGDLIVGDRLLLVRGQIVEESGSMRMLAREVSDISLANFNELQVVLNSKAQTQHLASLSQQAELYGGDIPLKVRVPVEGTVDGTDLKRSHVLIETPYKVQTNPKFISWIEGQFGKGSAQLI